LVSLRAGRIAQIELNDFSGETLLTQGVLHSFDSCIVIRQPSK
jgi:hypothetical protein